MGEEVKKEEVKKESVETKEEEKKTGETLKIVLKYILGIVLVGLGIWAVVGFWSSVWILIKGCIGVFLILAGAITLAIAKD
ncbi:MAG: hypothetical protein B6D56_01305 [Candidatus Omnitrophica bacterium 4484_70.1]|nr:MAG: hypothetical protein B6D56_01305 [Candidatus Omnitrophica bacterium 4484_70.1]